MPTLTWTHYTNRCRGCNRTFRISQESIAEARAHYASEEDAALSIDFCHKCIEGTEAEGEYSVDAWPIDSLTSREVFAIAAALDQAFDGNTDELFPGVKDALEKVKPVREAAWAAGYRPQAQTSIQSQMFIDGCWPEWVYADEPDASV